jgi:hypothetical protein
MIWNRGGARDRHRLAETEVGNLSRGGAFRHRRQMGIPVFYVTPCSQAQVP